MSYCKMHNNFRILKKIGQKANHVWYLSDFLIGIVSQVIYPNTLNITGLCVNLKNNVFYDENENEIANIFTKVL